MSLGGTIVVQVLLSVALAADLWHNFRIMRAYAEMGRETSSSLAVTKDAKDGFSAFFPLCGWGTHGMHVAHVTVDVSVAGAFIFGGVSNPFFGVTLLMFLTGASILHWKQADAAEQVLHTFFKEDLDILSEAVRAGMIHLQEEHGELPSSPWPDLGGSDRDT